MIISINITKSITNLRPISYCYLGQIRLCLLLVNLAVQMSLDVKTASFYSFKRTLRLKDLCKSYKRWSDLVRKRLRRTSRAIIFLRANLESISCHATCWRVKSKILITGVEIHYRLPPYKPLSPLCLRWLADSPSTFVHVNGPVVRLLFSNLHTSCPIRIVSRVGNKNNGKTTSTCHHLSSFGDTVLEIHVNYSQGF